MVNGIKATFIFICVIASSVASATELTEAAVKNLIDKVDKATIALNTSGIAEALSNNVIIVMHVNVQGKDHTVTPTKEQYISMLEQGWTAYKDYKYSKSGMVITMQGSKAVVKSNIIETMTIKGKEISGSSKEEVTVEMVNGKPLVTKVVGYTDM